MTTTNTQGAAAPSNIRAQENVALLADILTRRPAMNAGLFEAYANWTCEVYNLMGAMAAEPANDAPAQQPAPSSAAADTVVLEAALRAIHQAIDLIGEPDTERLRTVRRVLRGAVVVAEDCKEQPNDR